MKRIAQIEKSFLRDNIPAFGPGDTVKVHVKIKEGEKERIQVFQGAVISRKGGGLNEMFTVRKVSSGIGVERVFPLHSPNIAKIEKIRTGDVRRAKLYYLRELTGKSARIKGEMTSGSNGGNGAEDQEASSQSEEPVQDEETTQAEETPAVEEEKKEAEVKETPAE